MRGESLVVASGCFACHGVGEADARANFRAAGGSWRPRGIGTFWESGLDEPAAISEWIREGVPPAEAERHRQLLIQMPAYGAFVGEAEIDAMAAWILAMGFRYSSGMGNSELPIPDDLGAAELTEDQILTWGDRLSRKHGCYQCHGELGQGGPSNLLAFKGYIPGFFGSDFRDLTDGGDPQEILHWIDHGRGATVESGLLGALAKGFFDRQAIPMPAYADLISESEKAVLVDFLLLLNQMGPLDARAVSEVIETISQNVQEEYEPSPLE